jgi:hypothetical protein
MTTKEYRYFHIPAVGRCGNMLEIRNDTPYCEYDNTVLPDDYCECGPLTDAAVFSKIMSAPLNNKAKLMDEKLFSVLRERTDEAKMQHWEIDEMNQYLEHEARMRRIFETEDISMSMGEEY